MTISPDTKNPTTQGTNTTEANANYEISIKLESINLQAGDKPSASGKANRYCDIRLGMEGRVDIISQQESILQFLLRKARLGSLTRLGQFLNQKRFNL